ncbi:MAG: hypothetical protein Ct9H300mP31_00540 [Acidimicrobiaceae bacterium]|nr:MAG: hypothetical protein Ct9H300mP31_00540 [Acidimicrobiaceae bacterium]
MTFVETPVATNGIRSRLRASSAMSAVRMARVKTDVWTTSGRIPASARRRAPSRASASPNSVRSQSCQPVNWLVAFHSLWPWRNRISVGMVSSNRGIGGPANGTRLVSLAPAKISAQMLLN